MATKMSVKMHGTKMDRKNRKAQNENCTCEMGDGCVGILEQPLYGASLMDTDYYMSECQPISLSSGLEELLPITTTRLEKILAWNR